ncbi:hypothetical protein F4604DRAFT_1922778 [Suillus subluteus]|nr:hypothetical protein F4604DRAFT_1922778 [Suillus subluteus]
MTKSKNNMVHDHNNSADVRPTKKARLTDTGGENNECETTKNSESSLNQEEDGNVPNKISTEACKNPSTMEKRGSGALQPTLTVHSVIPNPTKCLMDKTEIEGYDETLIA